MSSIIEILCNYRSKCSWILSAKLQYVLSITRFKCDIRVQRLGLFQEWKLWIFACLNDCLEIWATKCVNFIDRIQLYFILFSSEMVQVYGSLCLHVLIRLTNSVDFSQSYALRWCAVSQFSFFFSINHIRCMSTLCLFYYFMSTQSSNI